MDALPLPEQTLPLAAVILAAIDRGATILTANQRAARTLHLAYELAQRARGEVRWTPPQIFALDTWLPTLWHRLLLTGAEQYLLLNRTQEHTLWRSLIAADREVSGLRSPDVLAELAADAWRRLLLSSGRAQLQESAVSTDTRAFLRWVQQFERISARERYLTHAQLPSALEAALGRGELDLPGAGLALVDFDDHPAAVASLIGSIESAGYVVEQLRTLVPSIVTLHAAADDSSELRAAAHWARDLLTAKPRIRIAIVPPNLADRRSEIERTVDEILPQGTFEFSLGRPLAETSFASAALDVLSWALEPLPSDRVTALLLSPYFATSEPVAEFDAYDLRGAETLRPELSIEDVVQLLRDSDRKQKLAQLHARLRALNRAARPVGEAQPQTHAHWADAFRAVLEPTLRSSSEDSLDFQTRRRWESALDELSTLDFNSVRLTAGDALRSLTRIATRTIFAPESANAPIQILGPLELGGAPFDALWFLSADDRSWPVQPASNPLLPWQLQRALSMPGADPAHDTQRAQTLTRRVAGSAAECVFSYATQSVDGLRRPSPLLKALHFDAEKLDFADRVETHAQPVPLELVADDAAVSVLPATLLRGGAKVLELQAACGFRAFAERRLYSAELDAAEPGMDAAERGNLVHRVMQAFWNQLKTQQALRELPLPARDALLAKSIMQALRRTQQQIRGAWDEAYVEVQRRRLHRLLEPWLDVELKRPWFEVLATEQEAKAVTIGPLTLDVRVDRVDETDGGRLILDYKTGAAKTDTWLTDRPDAPQLPLYAVLAEPETLGGVAFAILRAGEELDLKGFADTEGVFGSTGRMDAPTLAGQIEEWHRILENLAYAFASGDAEVLPKAYPQTCKYCAQRILCRLDPATLPQFGDDEEEQPFVTEEFAGG